MTGGLGVIVILLIAEAFHVSCVTHTLRYYFTRLSDKDLGQPQFSAVGLVDNKEFVAYDSESQVRPLTECMVKNEGPDYGDRLLQIAKSLEPLYRYEVKALMRRLNQTGGFHSFQEVFGCELRDDGTTAGYIHFGYDGKDFLYLDTETWVWVANVYEAQITVQRWNNPETRKGERDKDYLENICIDLLKEYFTCGREILEKKVRPEVHVWGRVHHDGMRRLHCLVYGFQPRDVDVKWVKNGIDDIPTDEMSPILPHPDGTYQIRVSVEVPSSDRDSYSCHVNHSSLAEILIVKWKPDPGITSAVVAVIVLFCLLVAAIGGFYWWKRRNSVTDPSSTGGSMSAGVASSSRNHR